MPIVSCQRLQYLPPGTVTEVPNSSTSQSTAVLRGTPSVLQPPTFKFHSITFKLDSSKSGLLFISKFVVAIIKLGISYFNHKGIGNKVEFRVIS